MLRPLVLPAAALAVLACALGACARPPAAPREAFVDRAHEWGLDFTHFNGRSGERYMLEVLGPGVAVLDYDGDGDLDVYLPQGTMLGPGKTLAQALDPPAAALLPLRGRLFRNDLGVNGTGAVTPRFVDVTAESGLAADGYGLGVATGDYDDDGAVDLYLTSYGWNRLWRNRGDGTFEDASERAGAADDRFAVSATFFDFDRDGRLDLFLAGYVDFTFANHQRCASPTGGGDYCGPASFRPVPDRLLRNRGDGTFEDVTERAGLLRADGPGLGVAAADLDGDGWLDLYVANDGAPNQLWINRRDGTFEDEALIAGAAVNAAGLAEAGMGVDAGDYDADGDLDLFLTHLTGETNTLYANLGNGTFEDLSRASGLGPPSFPFTSFGTRWLDYDHDGWLDLLVVSGAIRDIPERVAKHDPFPLKQTNQLFRNLGGDAGERQKAGGAGFADATATAGKAFQLPAVGRGAAFGDLDLDSDTDVVVTANAGPAQLLVNQVGSDRPWLRLRVLDARSGRDLVGSEVVVRRTGAPALLAHVHTDGSYASASEPAVEVGLGRAAEIDSVELRLPDGSRRSFRGLAAGRLYLLRL